MEQKKKSVINVGTTSLVLIFAVLALVVFAMLSYISANAQWKLAEKMAERMTAYYMDQELSEETTESEQVWNLLQGQFTED